MKIRTLTALVSVLFLIACFTLNAADEKHLGWTEENRANWYRASQGSRLIPADWFFALERHDSNTAFADVEYLTHTFGFLEPPSYISQDLPLGFTRDGQDDSKLNQTKLKWYTDQKNDESNAEQWIGLNCSACHTNRLSLKGSNHIIDGAPGLIDFQSFVENLDLSLIQTRADDEKWNRFSRAVLNTKDSSANRLLLQESVDQFLAWQKLTDDLNETPLRYGYGRLDAFGHIFNKILMFSGASANDGNASNAPVSIPFLWNIWRQQKVQWNGVAENSRLSTPGDDIEYGALGRNTGEVLGVFGDISITPHISAIGDLKGFDSSVRTTNLIRMELLLQKLEPPPWPEDFPNINAEIARQGEALFEQSCSSCHKTADQWKANEPTEIMVSFESTMQNHPENLTDIWMACNTYVYSGPTNVLKGRKDNEGNVMSGDEAVVTMVAATVKGALLGDAGDLVKESVRNFFGIRNPPVIDDARIGIQRDRNPERDVCLAAKNVPILAYKARPLDGIWATAPYLHNGSVPSLYELLLPVEERSKRFFVGNREYDPVKVGFVNSATINSEHPQTPALPAFELATETEEGVVIEGNGNHGHDYGAANFSESERFALVEYMKTL